jgi:hypothetical protein
VVKLFSHICAGLLFLWNLNKEIFDLREKVEQKFIICEREVNKEIHLQQQSS